MGVEVAVAVGLGTSVGVEIAGDGGRIAGVEWYAWTIVVSLHSSSDKPMMAIRTRIRKEGLRLVVLSEIGIEITSHISYSCVQ